MTATAEKVGMGKCPRETCNQQVAYRRSSGGKLRYTCPSCDASAYAEPGGKAYKYWMSLINEPATNDEPTPTKKSDPAPARGGFSLDQLGA